MCCAWHSTYASALCCSQRTPPPPTPLSPRMATLKPAAPAALVPQTLLSHASVHRQRRLRLRRRLTRLCAAGFLAGIGPHSPPPRGSRRFMAGRPQMALAILALTPHGAFVFFTTAHLRLPRPSHPSGAFRESSITTPTPSCAKSSQLPPPQPCMPQHPILARDVPESPASACGCRVITGPVALPLPQPPHTGTH